MAARVGQRDRAIAISGEIRPHPKQTASTPEVNRRRSEPLELPHPVEPTGPLCSSSDDVSIATLKRTLKDLGGVKKLADLGSAGPLVASAGKESLFNCLFGRDSIRMATDLAQTFPAVARATILALAELQGVKLNPRGEEEPGRILHENRPPDDPHYAQLTKHWDLPYYGAVDSTPNWINLVALHAKAHGPEILDTKFVDRNGSECTVREAVARAAEWIAARMDRPNAHGYVTVQRASEHGIPNQVWEDSGDSYYDETGKLLDHREPYAPVHVQGYAYDALLNAADILGRSDLRARAGELRDRVLAEMWQPDLNTFALALTFDREGRARPARVVSSSAGHLLASRILDGDSLRELRDRLVERLFEPDLLCGSGIRTKSTTSPRFRAGSYHNGSSWPMDTGVVIDGLRRHGYDDRAIDLEDRILRGCARIGGFPEFFRGDPDGGLRVNVKIVDAIVDGVPNRLEQPPQAEQGWTATRVWKILAERGAVKPPVHT